MTKAHLQYGAIVDIENNDRVIDAQGKPLTFFDHKLNRIIEPEHKLSLAILNSAKLAADSGDVGAIIFLIVYGSQLEDLLLPGYDDTKQNHNLTMEFCKKVWGKIESGQLKAKWASKELEKDFLDILKGKQEKMQNDDLTD